MLAYDRSALDNRFILENVADWQARELLPEEKATEIRARHRDVLYSPHWAMRLGMAIFGLILANAALGFIFLIFSNFDESLKYLLVVFGIGLIVAMENLVIRNKRHYRSGLDDVFLYFGLSCSLGGLFWILEGAPSEIIFVFVATVCGLAAWRYTDTIAALTCFFATIGLLFSLTNRIAGEYTALALPFVGMLFSGFVWRWTKTQRDRPDSRYWYLPLDLLEAASLLVFYACGNFWCLTIGAIEFFGMTAVPLPALFWTFTMVVPPLMIWLGLRQKDRILLDIGLFLVAMALLTVRNFHSVMPLSWAATLSGAALLTIAIITIRYLRRNPAGKFSADQNDKTSTLQRLQTFVMDRASIRQQEAANTGRSGSDF